MTHTENEMLDMLADLAPTNNFCDSVLRQYQTKGTLSEKQWAAVSRIVTQQQTGVASTDANSVELRNIRRMFNKAAQKLKYPRITIKCGSGSLQFSFCGPKSNAPGHIRITNGVRYGEVGAKFYGTIDLDGFFIGGFGNCERDRVLAFNENPTETAKAEGHSTGCCCFCRLELTDPRSVAAGYGPTCAGNYGMPWGN